MAACAIDEAIRNTIAVGGTLDNLAGLDNFCWCDPVQSEKTPDGEYKLAQLVRANMALYDYTREYGVPCISGKDSMKNDYQIGTIKISIPPTLLFSTIGKMNDVRKAVTMDAKKAGHLVYILGETYAELGGSEWFAHHGYIGNRVPRVNAGRAKELYRSLSHAIKDNLVASCHDCSDGGLGVHLRNLVIQQFGAAFASTKINIKFHELEAKEICQIVTQPAKEPVILSIKDKNGQSVERFYVRSGNSSQDVPLGEMNAYIKERFHS